MSLLVLMGGQMGRTLAGGEGAASLLPFSDAFTRADGDLAGGWEYTAGKWEIVSNAVRATPGLGADLVTNGTFAADANWTKGGGWTIGSGVAARDGTAGQTDIYQDLVLTVGQWYQLDWELVAHTSGSGFSGRIGSSGSLFKTAPATYSFVARALATAPGVRGNAENGTMDNIVARKITLADMFATRVLGASSVDVRADTTVADLDAMVGLVACLDSLTVPANFLLAYVRRDGAGDRIVLDKCVAGTYTNLITHTMTGTTAYSAGGVLRLVKSGTSVEVYYRGVQCGTTQTVSDAGISSNTRHGLFAPKGGANRLDAFFCS